MCSSNISNNFWQKMNCATYANAKTIKERNEKERSKAAASNPFNTDSNNASQHFNINPFSNPFDEFN
jgi:hypothetical protein